MSGFKSIRDLNDAEFRVLPFSSVTAAVGDLVELVSGSANWTACTASSNHFTPKAVVMETMTSASTGLCYLVKGNEEWSAEAANAANTAHNGDLMILTDTNTVNNTGSTSTAQEATFLQTGKDTTAGQTTQILGRILVGNGVDPDAS